MLSAISAGLLLIDMPAVNVAAGGVVAIEHLAAAALHPGIARLARLPFLSRQALPGIPERILACRPIALIAPGLKVRICAFCEEDAPCSLKGVAGFSDAVPEVQSPGSEPG